MSLNQTLQRRTAQYRAESRCHIELQSAAYGLDLQEVKAVYLISLAVAWCSNGVGHRCERMAVTRFELQGLNYCL